MADLSKTDDNQGCRNSGVPLGGIGAGSLEIRPDGYFYRWHLMNNRPWGAGPATEAMERYGLRFGMQCRQATGPQSEFPSPANRAFALGLNYGKDPIPDNWFLMDDPYHLPWISHANRIDFAARLPFARLDYHLHKSPVQVSLRAWSPLIPHQAQESSTPGAYLEFTLTNVSKQRQTVSLFGALRNCTGYDQPDLPSHITPAHINERAALVFERADIGATASSNGTMVLSVAPAGRAQTTWTLHPRNGRDLWESLHKSGRFENQNCMLDPSKIGEQGAEKEFRGPRGLTRGALCATFELAPRTATTVTFILAWHFPNFHEMPGKVLPGNRIGVQYANRFRNATEVASWMIRNRDRLLEPTARFFDAFYASSLPDWELQAVAAGLSVLYRSAWWDKSGRFGIWEGLGCCGLQTIDVGHYSSWVVLQFFPELDASQNRLSAANVEPNGKVPHMMPGRFDCSDASGKRGRIDLPPQFILAVWRHVLWTGDKSEAKRLWPVVEKNIEWMANADSDGDGLPNNEGPDQTYDQFPLHGTSALVGFLYVGSLQAAADLSDWSGRKVKAQTYRQMAKVAAEELNRQLWNGKYFNLSHDTRAKHSNTGCMADQLNGDWFLRQSRMTGLVQDPLAKKALTAMFELCHRTTGETAWLANCVWPKKDGVSIPRRTSDQANSPWSGVEYAIAAHMILCGLRGMGRRVTRDAFDRYERYGMRYNHFECGEFYYRAMSSWAVYLAEFGICYDAIAQLLRLAPPRGDARFVVPAPSFTAAAEWNEKTRRLNLTVLDGALQVKGLEFRGSLVPLRRTVRAGQKISVKV